MRNLLRALYLLRALPEIAPVPASQLPPLEVGLNRFSALTDAEAVSQEMTEHLCGENVELNHLVAEKCGSGNIKILHICHASRMRLYLVPPP